MTFFIKSILLAVVFFISGVGFPTGEASVEVMPYKFDKILPTDFVIPPQIRHTIPRLSPEEPDIVYYLSKPKNVSNYPIVIVCGGSYERSRLYSIFHIHRYFFQEFMDLGLGVLTAEEWGIDGHKIDADVFMEHYTRTQRFEDHKILMDHLLANPPEGWNGKFVLFGISEGAQLVTRLSEEYPSDILATVSWAGSGAWQWRDELWMFIGNLRAGDSWWNQLVDKVSQWVPFMQRIPATREKYDVLMDHIEKNPVATKEFMEMTYQYHADGCAYPLPCYEKLTVPFLDVVGGLDPAIESFDDFAKCAEAAGCPITYVRIDDMNHYIRRSPYAGVKTFNWLEEQLAAS